MSGEHVVEVGKSRSSVEVTKNAQNKLAWRIKIYYEDGEEDDALKKVDHVHKELLNTY